MQGMQHTCMLDGIAFMEKRNETGKQIQAVKKHISEVDPP
jgi:hypothetical protein